MKKTIRMNERELHRIINESVKRVLAEGNFWNNTRNKFYGASRGWREGNNQIMQNDEDAMILRKWATIAGRVLQDNNPQEMQEFIQKFYNHVMKDKQIQNSSYETQSEWQYR